jgi:hypothetical protein
VTSAVFYFVYSIRRGEPEIDSWRHDFLSHVNDVAAILIGGVLAIAGIILAIQDRPSIRILKRSGHYRDLISYLIQASTWTCLLVAFSLTIMLFMLGGAILKPNHFWHRVLIASWLFFFVTSGLSYYRLIRLVGAVLLYDTGEEVEEEHSPPAPPTPSAEG